MEPSVTKEPGIKFGLFSAVGLVIIGVVIIFSAGHQTVVSAETTGATSSSLNSSLNQLQIYIAVKPGIKPPLIYANAYALVDSNSAEIIIGKNTDLKLAIASTTKMTTALVAAAKLSPDKIVTVSTKAPLIEGSKVGLKSGEKITVGSLLKGLLINSGNDAAETLAETYADTPGDQTQFVQAMNDFLQSHHITNTSFTDPAGLDDDTGRSTPADLANIARLLLNNPDLAKIVDTPTDTISSVDGQIVHPLKNTNRLIEVGSPFYLPGAFGIKTGYTPAAGHCLIGAYHWHDRVLIGVVMNTTESTNTASAAEMYKLFRWADSSLTVSNY